MSRDQRTKAVIRYLEENNYAFLQPIGQGGFADVIAVRTPNGRNVAVKIIDFNKIWDVEDERWPLLHHPHLLPVEDVLIINKLRVKLYFMPILPNSLDDILRSDKFRKDPRSFNRIRKWLIQILSALEHLHSNGLCHLDLKTDNILIDKDDNAVLGDFSGLNFTIYPISRLCSPKMYRPPECFTYDGARNVQGEAFDIWTYAILVLNVLTRDYFYMKARRIPRDGLKWNKHLKPIINKALKESKFKRLLKKTYPKCSFSASNIQEGLHFVNFIMNFSPQDRPNASRVKRHPFLKKLSNPFMEDLRVSLQIFDDNNPFRKYHYADENCSIKEETVNPSIENRNRRNIEKSNWFMRNMRRMFK